MSAKPNKVVCRIQKIHSIQQVGMAGSHNLRKESEATRDHTNDKNNVLLVGTSDLVGDVKKRLDDAEKNANGKFRSNAVLAVEMILSATPEYFKQKGALKSWVESNMKWLKKEYGKNLVNVVLHLDEQTPHMHIILVPIDQKNKLNCREFFGGKAKLKHLQDASYEAVKHLGIIRGIPKARDDEHTETREWVKQNREADQEKASISKAINNIPEIESNITGLVKAEKADLYYKKKTTEAVVKAYLPKLKAAIKKEKETSDRNKILEEKQKAIEIEIKETRKRNFELSQQLEENFNAGYKKRVNEELKEKQKAVQDNIYRQQQKLTPTDSINKNTKRSI